MPVSPSKTTGGAGDSNTSKLLYAIIKQVGINNVDWAKIAEELQIATGPAARMRWIRFRDQMESKASEPDDAAESPSKPAATPTKRGRPRKNTVVQQDAVVVNTTSSTAKAEETDSSA